MEMFTLYCVVPPVQLKSTMTRSYWLMTSSTTAIAAAVCAPQVEAKLLEALLRLAQTIVLSSVRDSSGSQICRVALAAARRIGERRSLFPESEGTQSIQSPYFCTAASPVRG